MKIGIDISQIVYEGTGVARFTKGLVNAILNYDKENEWLLFFSSLRRNLDPKIERRIKKGGHRLIKRKIPPTLLSFLWNDLHNFSKHLTSNILHLTSLDWFITSDWTEPPLSVKKATIVHDLVYFRYPETVDSKILAVQQRRLALVKKESKIIFSDSQTTKDDLVNLLHINAKKIYVNYPGVTIEKPSTMKIEQTLKKYNLIKPFILTVGKLEPRKNIQRLIQAFRQLKNETIDLIIVGPKGWDASNISHLTSNIKYLGYIPDTDMYALYSSCLFFIFASIWEGFGYPIVEAMKLDVPVTTSNTSSLKEIAKNAAILFDPLNVDQMYQCIDTLIHHEKLRQELRQKGLERSKMFTWKNYYNKLIKVLYDNRS